MDDLSVVKVLNDAFDKLYHTEINDQYTLFLAKAAFFAVQEKNYFVIGTRIVINPFMFACKRKYKRHIDELFDLFDETNVDSYPAFKTRNAAKRAVAYNRKHKHLTGKHSFEVELNGIKTIRVEPSIFKASIELGENNEKKQ